MHFCRSHDVIRVIWSPSPSSLISSPNPMCSSPTHTLKSGLDSYNKAINIAMLRAWEYCNVARKRTDDSSASPAGLDFY